MEQEAERKLHSGRGLDGNVKVASAIKSLGEESMNSIFRSIPARLQVNAEYCNTTLFHLKAS